MYIYGGLDGQTTFADFYAYNFNSSTWSSKPTTSGPGPRKRHTSVAISNKLIIFGGLNDVNQVQNSVHIFDHFQQTWSTGAQPSIGVEYELKNFIKFSQVKLFFYF